MRRRPVVSALILALLAPAGAAAQAGPAAGTTPAPVYRVYAIRYAVLPGFPLNGLVEGADSTGRIDLAMMVWLLRGPGGRTVLVDAGFHRDSLVKRWKPRSYERPDSAVRKAGVRAEQVTDLVLTHLHWDHADGVDLFPRAHVWVQKAEYEHYTAPGRPGHEGVTAEDAAYLERLKADGRLTLVDGDGREILPGIVVYTGGKHTFESQYLGVRTAQGTTVVASDNVYLYLNLERHAPIAQTLDRASNLAAQARMLELATSPRLIVPGHDPAVFVRFPRPGDGVAEIR